MLIGLILGTAAAISIIYMLVRLYCASKENAKKQFLHDIAHGDIAFIPFAGPIGDVKAAVRNSSAGEGRGSGQRPSDTRNQNKSLRTGTGA
jgi:hypothetical protein